MSNWHAKGRIYIWNEQVRDGILLAVFLCYRNLQPSISLTGQVGGLPVMSHLMQYSGGFVRGIAFTALLPSPAPAPQSVGSKAGMTVGKKRASGCWHNVAMALHGISIIQKRGYIKFIFWKEKVIIWNLSIL